MHLIQLLDRLCDCVVVQPLKIIADAFRDGVFCNNLYEVEVKSPEQTLQLLEFAELRSKQQEMVMNKSSFRAHRVFMVGATCHRASSLARACGRQRQRPWQ